MVKVLNFKNGILLDKTDLGLLQVLIIKEQME
jgi:hypothetical protein